jgi:hypothetical protein
MDEPEEVADRPDAVGAAAGARPHRYRDVTSNTRRGDRSCTASTSSSRRGARPR